MNQAVSEYLDHYLDEAPPGRGAVLLTGPWGAGKTFFIEAYLAERDARRKKAEPLSGPSHLYVSLYGVRTPEDIKGQFFAQTNPGLNSGGARLIGLAASRVANTLTRGQAFQKEDKQALKDFLARDIKGVPLVFDDLERCAGPLPEIMGYINSFVEHEGAKVILLANEAEIPKKERGDFRKRKEKLVSKTLEVRTDPAVVYAAWAGELRGAAARVAALANEAAAIRTFRASGISNLRSLRAVLDDFDRLVSAVDPRLGASPPAASRLLTYMIATGLELRTGELQPDQLDKLAALRMERIMVGVSRREMKPELKPLAAIADKYPDVEWRDSVVAPEALGRLYATGVIDRDAINAGLAEHPLVVPPSEAPSWRRLWRWFEIGPAEYAEVRARFVQDFAEHAFTHPGPILHAAGLTILLRGHGDDLLGGRTTPDAFADYLDELERQDRLEPAQGVLESIDETGFAGLGYPEHQSDDFKAVRKLLAASVERVLEKRLREAAPPLLERLRSDRDAYAILYEYGRGETNFGSVPVLHHMDVGSFAAVALPDGVPDDRLLAAVHERYRRDHDGRLIGQEQAWLDALRTELQARADALPPPYPSRVSKRLGYWWTEIDAAVREAHARARMQSGMAEPVVTLRPMTAEDLEVFASWFPDPAEDPGVPEPAPDWIGAADPAAWTAEVDGAAAGFVQASRADPFTGEPRPDRVRINIAVAPERRGVGVGRSLIEAFLALPDTPPIVEALVSPDNEASRLCLLATGFTEPEDGPDKDGSLLYVRQAT